MSTSVSTVHAVQCKQMLAQARTSTSIYTDWPTLLNYVQVWLSTPAVCRVSFRIFIKGGGGNATIPELRGGGKDYIMFFHP